MEGNSFLSFLLFCSLLVCGYVLLDGFDLWKLLLLCLSVAFLYQTIFCSKRFLFALLLYKNGYLLDV